MLNTTFLGLIVGLLHSSVLDNSDEDPTTAVPQTLETLSLETQPDTQAGSRVPSEIGETTDSITYEHV